MPKHLKRSAPSNKDLRDNPQIGGSKGATMAGATPDELEDFQGENTFEGDVGNDTNAQGGIDKPGRKGRPATDRSGRTRAKPHMQGKKTHEQQLRTLERKPDVPDARQMEAELDRVGQDDKYHKADKRARDSEFTVSRGGLHQESKHNKHNRSERS
jgi:hypothetical protein